MICHTRTAEEAQRRSQQLGEGARLFPPLRLFTGKFGHGAQNASY